MIYLQTSQQKGSNDPSLNDLKIIDFVKSFWLTFFSLISS